jgi:hypothetical protein
MIIKSFLIADSPICGNNQVISGTIRYPWKGCKVADELETRNKKVIEDALALAKEYGFANIRDVKCYYKEIQHKQWNMVSLKMVRQIIEPFSQKVEKIPEHK